MNEPSAPRIPDELVERLLSQTIAVNDNVGTLISQNEAMMRRQNALITLFIIGLTLLCIQLGLGLAQQRLQEAARVQLAAAEAGRTLVQSDLASAKVQVDDLRKMVGAMRQQLQSVPTVTSDKAGRINLEVAVIDTPRTHADTTSTVHESKVPSGNRLVIPLKPSQSRLSSGP